VTTEPADSTPDLVGRTSARLLADGVERRDRLEALRLLAVLDASTDTSGMVRRPLDDLAAEFDLPLLGVLRSLEHLQRAGAVLRVGGAVQLLGRPATGIGGLGLADFLDDVRDVRGDTTVDWSVAEVLEPDLVEIVPHRERWLRRAGAAVAAVAAAVGVLTLAPSQPVATTTSSASAPEQTSAPTAAGDALTAIGVNTSVTTEARDAEPAGDASEPAAHERTTTTQDRSTDLPPEETLAASTCTTTGSPSVELISGLLLLSNSWTSDLVVTELIVDGAPMATSITVPAGKRVEQLLPTTSHVVQVGQWEWVDDGSVPRCDS
jgi:hypothetical protein